MTTFVDNSNSWVRSYTVYFRGWLCSFVLFKVSRADAITGRRTGVATLDYTITAPFANLQLLSLPTFITETNLSLEGVGKATVGELMVGTYEEASEAAKQLFQLVVLEVLAGMNKNYHEEVKIMLGKKEENHLADYMKIVKSCDLAFVKVVLELCIKEMLECRKKNKPFKAKDADENGKKKCGRKKHAETLEDKEDNYIDYVDELKRQRDEVPKDETVEQRDQRLSWYVGALAILKKEEEEKKARRKAAQESSDKENKSGDGQRVGEAVSKKRKRKSYPTAVPDDGFEGFKPKIRAVV